MPHKTASRLRELLEQLQRAQRESGGVAEQARQELAGVINGGELRPVGTIGAMPRKKKAGRKKR
jgi:hypothetical protein